MIRLHHLALCTMLLLSIGTSLFAAEFGFNGHYTSNMVLQREKPVLIRGTSEKGASVKVTFAGQTKDTKANDAGEWTVTLDAMKANAKGQTLTATSSIKNQKSEIKNVLVGDVFLFARQTSIDVSLGRDEEGRKAAADVESVRVIVIKTTPTEVPQHNLAKDATAGWATLDKATALKMSAATFYTAKDLSKTAGVPIGIIDLNLGHHFPIAWLSKDALLQTKEIFDGAGQVDSIIKMMEKKMAAYVAFVEDPKTLHGKPVPDNAPTEGMKNADSRLR